MKQDTFLFIFALVLAFATGNISYLIKSDSSADINDIKEINEINNDLQLDYLPFIRLDLNSDYSTPEHLKLLLSIENMPGQNKSIQLNSTKCLKNKIQQLRSEYLDKESIWLGHLCNQIAGLPRDFFKSPPYLHSNGRSFAYMFYNSLAKSKRRQNWYYKHAKFMHLSELKKISWPLNARHQFLYTISSDIIDRLIKGDKIILSDRYYLIKTGNLKYFILEAYKAQRYFKRAGYIINNTEKKCFIRAGNICWKKRPHNIVSFLSQSTIIIFLGTFIIFLMTAKTLYLRIKKQKEEEERKKHALRVLTHELRTPVASLLLQIEHLSGKLAELPEEISEDVMKIESDIYRLKHLAEKSKGYLQTDSGDIVNFQTHNTNINHLCEEIIQEFHADDISLDADQNYFIETDGYWLKMCITNLIENSIRYGVAPINLKLVNTDQILRIDIIDQGTISHSNIKSVLKSKHKNSKGLGLGLKIINTTLKSMNGELSLSRKPTTFSISLRRNKS